MIRRLLDTISGDINYSLIARFIGSLLFVVLVWTLIVLI